MTPSRYYTVLFLSLLLSACSKPDYTELNGDTGRFADHKGQWVVINYWATWCKPCITEIPELNNFAKQHADNTKLFGVDYDQSPLEQLQQNSTKLGIKFTVLRDDPSVILGYPKPNVLPTTIIINPEGKLHKTLIGPQTEASLLQATQ
ncbi:MAG: TlpA disulfide reductase family protein [Spongiibacteraceae bacterium]